MISIKKNKKTGELQKANGLRTTAKSIYTPNQKEEFQISRGRFDNFLSCPRCFYLDRVKGLADPGMPGWALNSLTDNLLKIEFDHCREKGEPHRILEENDLSHIVPFKHPEMDAWRNSLHEGLKVKFKDTNIILQGGVDDIWIDTNTDELIVVDYKSQSKRGDTWTSEYLSDIYHEGYKRQLDFYNYLLQRLGYKTSITSYFLVVNGEYDETGFHGNMRFSEHLIPYEHDTSWIDSKVEEMIKCMNNESIPDMNESCENCAYAYERGKLEHLSKT